MYLIQLTYYVETAADVLKTVDGIPEPFAIEVTQVTDQREVEKIRESLPK